MIARQQIDIDQLKRQHNCRDTIERDLGQPTYRSTAYDKYACPLHNEQSGQSLVVWDTHWRCFGKCDTGGDVIAWTQQYHGHDFKQACEHLDPRAMSSPSATTKTQDRRKHQQMSVQNQGVQLLVQPERRTNSQDLIQGQVSVLGQGVQSSLHTEHRTTAKAEPPPKLWQQAVEQVIATAENTLWETNAGERALDYLFKRGLSEATLIDARLGYVPGHHQGFTRIADLTIPNGITIPWRHAYGQVWALKVRRATGDPKYMQIKGGNSRHGLYKIPVAPPLGLPILMTEGEFDALIAYQASRHHAGATAGWLNVISIGSAAQHRIHRHWYPLFLSASQILIAMDGDDAGQKAARCLGHLSATAQVITPPTGKDINDFALADGQKAVRDWLNSHIRHVS